MHWAQALADLIGLGQVAVRHHHHELLAAKPAGEIDAARVHGESSWRTPATPRPRHRGHDCR